jgi:hypothetical protein
MTDEEKNKVREIMDAFIADYGIIESESKSANAVELDKRDIINAFPYHLMIKHA